MNVQYIHDKHGETQFVILPIDEYRRLIDDNSDEKTPQKPSKATEFDDVTIPQYSVKIISEK